MVGGRRRWEIRVWHRHDRGIFQAPVRRGGELAAVDEPSFREVVALPRMRTEAVSGRVGRTAGTWRLRAVHRSSSSSAFASFRSGVSKPSVNQP